MRVTTTAALLCLVATGGLALQWVPRRALLASSAAAAAVSTGVVRADEPPPTAEEQKADDEEMSDLARMLAESRPSAGPRTHGLPATTTTKR
mmetsp:Transcript_14427/g.43722  ORF Transcript_14427/g.43722 Transcript_14427/m.43722 type:complete len:92 (+) Transcript_14427:67-342(+)